MDKITLEFTAAEIMYLKAVTNLGAVDAGERVGSHFCYTPEIRGPLLRLVDRGSFRNSVWNRFNDASLRVALDTSPRFVFKETP